MPPTPRRRTPLSSDSWYPASDPVARARFVGDGAGGRVRIVEAGRPGAPAAVLLHGWGGCAYSFRHVLPLLAESGVHAVAVDLLGHGASARPSEPARFARDAVTSHLLQVLDEAGVGGAVLVGQSMGGALALDLARAVPERFPSAVLLGSIGFTALRRIEVARALRGDRWNRSRVPRWIVRVILRRVYGGLRAWTDRDLDEYWSPLREPGTAATLLAWVRGYDWTIRQPPVPNVATPVRLRLLFGERDRLVPAARAVAHAARFPGATAEVVRHGGHLLAEEAPEVVARAVLGLHGRLA